MVVGSLVMTGMKPQSLRSGISKFAEKTIAIDTLIVNFPYIHCLLVFPFNLTPENILLVGGFNPFEKYAREVGSFPPGIEMKRKNH